MSHYHYMRFELNIKDENITFYDFTLEQVKGVKAKVYYGTLSYPPHACYRCGHVFDQDIIKHGFKSSLIVLQPVCDTPAYLKLRKQRYLCRHCGRTFTLKTSLVNQHCFISNNVKMAIMNEAAREVQPEKRIAQKYSVSASTVNRLLFSLYEWKRPNYRYLPKHLCFDAFKSVQSAKGAMSFLFCDAATGDIIDIVEDRRLRTLKDYFSRYPLSVRKKVQSIVIDMYSPYIQLIREMFPKASIVTDRFHVIQLIGRAFNKTRIKVMNADKAHYTKLKRYWKLFWKPRLELDDQNYRWSPCYRKLMSEWAIVND